MWILLLSSNDIVINPLLSVFRENIGQSGKCSFSTYNQRYSHSNCFYNSKINKEEREKEKGRENGGRKKREGGGRKVCLTIGKGWCLQPMKYYSVT